MASGAKLPNTNLNLIQDTDMIDYADINAIAQAIETTRGITNRFASVLPTAPAGNVGALATGIYWIDSANEYANLPDGHTWGVLMVYGLTSSTSLQIFVNQANLYYRTWVYSDTRWYGWHKLTGDQDEPVEAVLTADKFNTLLLKLHRIGRLCVTTGHLLFTEVIPTGGNHTIGMVPVGFRPPRDIQTWGISQATREMVMLRIETDGAIQVRNYGSDPLPANSALTANLTWITND